MNSVRNVKLDGVLINNGHLTWPQMKWHPYTYSMSIVYMYLGTNTNNIFIATLKKKVYF